MSAQAFAAIERDGDGKVSAAELGTVLSAAGINVTEGQLAFIIDKIDTDDDGMVELEELERVIKLAHIMFNKLFGFFGEMEDESVRSVLEEEEVKIPIAKLPALLKSLHPEIDDEKIDEIAEDADTNGDGFIDKEELLNITTD